MELPYLEWFSFRGKIVWVGFVDVVGLPFMIEYLGKKNYAPVILRGLPVFNHYITPLGCFRSAFWLQSNPRKLHCIEKSAILLRNPENSRIDAPR